MKNSELLFEVLGEIDPAPVQDAAPDTQSPGVRRRKRGIKPALLLAAAILLLTAAGAGANQILSRLSVRVRPEEGWEEDSPEARTEHNYGVKQLYTVDQEGAESPVVLSGEVMEKLRELTPITDRNASYSHPELIENNMACAFDTWREAADFLDCGLLTSPLLEQPPEQFTDNRVTLLYLDGVSLGRTEAIADLFSANVTSGGDWYSLSVRIPLNAEACGMGFGGAGVPESDADDMEVITSAHVTPSGIEAQIAAYRWGHLAENHWNGYAYFLHDSISYMLSTSGDSPEAVEALLCAVLDSME